MELNGHEKLMGVGVVVGAALLVLFLKSRSSATSRTSVGGANDLVGGYTTASTVYVPTTSETYNYVTNNGTMDTITTNNKTTSVYAPPMPVIDKPPAIVTVKPTSPVVQAHPITGPTTPPKHIATPSPAKPSPKPVPHPTPKPPVTHKAPTRPIIKPTPKPVKHTAPKPAPKPVHHVTPKPKPNPLLSALHGSGHYSTPHGGWNHGSVVDLLKSNSKGSSFSDREKLASAAGIHGYKGTASQNEALLNDLERAGVRFH